VARETHPQNVELMQIAGENYSIYHGETFFYTVKWLKMKNMQKTDTGGIEWRYVAGLAF